MDALGGASKASWSPGGVRISRPGVLDKATGLGIERSGLWKTGIPPSGILRTLVRPSTLSGLRYGFSRLRAGPEIISHS